MRSTSDRIRYRLRETILVSIEFEVSRLRYNGCFAETRTYYCYVVECSYLLSRLIIRPSIWYKFPILIAILKKRFCLEDFNPCGELRPERCSSELVANASLSCCGRDLGLCRISSFSTITNTTWHSDNARYELTRASCILLSHGRFNLTDINTLLEVPQ